MRKLTPVILALLLLSNVAVFAQTTRGSLSGNVKDPNDAAIIAATVTIKNAATGEELRSETNSQGAFTFPSISLGIYSVTVEAAGFKRTEITRVTVEVGTPAKIDVSLEIGAVTEQVTITGQSQEIINSTSPVLSKTITEKQVRDLPLLSRNPIDLARLQAGLSVPGTNVRNASVQGLRGGATNVTQDGINAMDNFVKGSSFFALTAPSLNATSEFSITVGTVGSNAGRGVAQVGIITKSGSNEFHGGVFYQHRNDALNANTFFNNATNTEKPYLRQHFFGVHAGGPVWIPKVYDGRNGKSLWFYAYEGFREPFSVTRNRTVLTEEARRGVFRYQGCLNPPQCTNTRLETVNLLSLGRFNSLNPLTTAQLNAMPLPNNTLLGDGLNTGGVRFNVPGTDPNDKHNFRFDQNLFSSEKFGSHKLEATFHRGTFLLTPDTFNGLEAPFAGGVNAFQSSTRTLWSAAIHSTFGSYMTNEARFGHNEAPVGFLRESFPDKPFINLGSVDDFDRNFLSQGRNTKLNQFVDNFSLVKGAHTFRMGADVQRVFAYTFNDAGINPIVNLGVNASNPDNIVDSNFPNLPRNANGSLTAVGTTLFNRARAIYRDLVGSLASSSATFNVTSPDSGFVPGATRGRSFGYNDVSFYFQDAWRAKRNLTLNYGLRWEYLGVTSNPDGLGLQITNFDDVFGVSGPGNVFNPNVQKGNAAATLDFVGGDSGRSLHKKDWNNFAPFLGFAWSPSFNSGPLNWILGGEGRSSIRGGYSISYLRDGFTIFSNALGVGTTNSGLIQTAANNTPTGVLTDAGVALTTPTFRVPITSAENFLVNSNNGLWAIDPNLATPYVQQWSFGIERELNANTAIEIRYAGNHAIKVYRAVDYNEANIFENGFLQEFLNAQKNLAARGGTSFAPGAAGTVALPIFSALFSGLPAGSGFTSSTFIANLNQNNIGTLANTLAYSPTYRTTRANLAPNFFVANPNAAFARVLGNGSYSNYHSLQIEIRRRFAAGLQFQANYTLSRSLNDGTGISNNQSSLESHRTLRNLRLDYQNSDQDQRHRFVANGIYDLPFGTGRRYLNSVWSPVRKVVEGWTLGAIVTYQSGSPFFFTSNRTTFNNFNGGTNPAQLLGISFDEIKKNLGIYKTGSGVFFINPALLDIDINQATGQINSSNLKSGLLGAPAPGTFGNFPLNSLFGPNFTQTDLSLVKRTNFSESGNVEFRVTAFNAFNHANFTHGNNIFDSSSFGRITGTTGSERQFHFVLGINW